MEELIEKAKSNDKKAFSELIVSIEKELYLIAKTKLKSDEDIEDAKKDGCIIIYNDETEEKDKIDSFIEKTKNGQKAFIRIYNKKEDYYDLNQLEIMDLQYENGIYYYAKVLLYTDMNLNRQEIGKVYDYSLYDINIRRYNVDNDALINIYGNKYKEGTSIISIITLKDK